MFLKNNFNLIQIFENIIFKSGFVILSLEKANDKFLKFTITKNNEIYNILVNIGNINSAYLKNKPTIMRRQVSSLSYSNIPPNKNKNLVMLIGIKKIEENYVLVCWNPFQFTNHKTNRSCYVSEESIFLAKNNGFCEEKYGFSQVLLCFENNLEYLIKVYEKRNSID